MTADTPDRNRWLALYVLCGGVLMIVLDATIVNVALPSIQDSLDFSQSNLAWVVNAYLIPFGGLLLLAGRMGDLIGQRRIFLIGLTVFIARLAGLRGRREPGDADRRPLLRRRRRSALLRGRAGDDRRPCSPSRGSRRKRSASTASSPPPAARSACSPAAILTQAISWHWIFLINLPIGIAVAFGALRLVEDSPGIGMKEGADIPGAALITGSLMIGTYSILGISEHGWLAAQTLILSAVSALFFAAFIWRQARIENPLMPLGLFRSRNVSGANAIQALLVAGMFGMFFLGALYLQRVLGYDALQVGLAFLPATVVMGTLSLGFSEKLIMRFGPRTTLIPGVAVVGLGLLLFARTPVDGNYLLDVMPPMLLIGLGVGTSFPSLMTLAMSGASPSEAGLASGVVNTSMQVGGAIGLAVLATLATERTDGKLAEGVSRLEALNSGFHVAYLVGAALVAHRPGRRDHRPAPALAGGDGRDGRSSWRRRWRGAAARGGRGRQAARLLGRALGPGRARARVHECLSALNRAAAPADNASMPSKGYDERARMGRISGGLWIVGALVGAVGVFLPGAAHQETIWVLALSAAVLAYGIGSVTGAIPWQRASLDALAIGMVVTVPVVGLAIYLTGGSISYIEPLLVCSLLYAAFFFPPRWAWPLSIELVLVAGAPLLYDADAVEYAFVPRYLALTAAFLAVTGVMVSLKRRLVEAEATQREIANRDPLTGIANRRAFDDALRRELDARSAPLGRRREADEEPLSLILVDLDEFKSINDDHGHQVGDTVLREAADRAGSVLRSSDLLARIGGDEFAVIAPGAHGEGARRLAEAIRTALAVEEANSHWPTPRASVGLASFPEDGSSFEGLLRVADQRLLRVKNSGRHLSPRGRESGTLRLI